MSTCWKCGGTGQLQPYKDHTPLHAIIEDGWSRGFDISQTAAEAAEMGYDITEEDIRRAWNSLDANMTAHFKKQELEVKE